MLGVQFASAGSIASKRWVATLGVDEVVDGNAVVELCDTVMGWFTSAVRGLLVGSPTMMTMATAAIRAAAPTASAILLRRLSRAHRGGVPI